MEGSHWIVDKASINTESERTLSYQYNDDRLVGRSVYFNKDNITSSLPGKVDCQQPVYNVSQGSLDPLIHEAMGDADSASAKSYELDIKENESISVINTDCKSGSFGGGDTDKNSWIAMPDSEHMLVNWNDGIILTLSPVIAGTPPTPSFSCAKAKSPSEKAICADYELSSWDKSVNSAWKSAQAGAISVGDKELKDRIVASQKEWLKKRNACEDDVSCIRKVWLKDSMLYLI